MLKNILAVFLFTWDVEASQKKKGPTLGGIECAQYSYTVFFMLLVLSYTDAVKMYCYQHFDPTFAEIYSDFRVNYMP
jgi:hypothetical protein